MLRVTLQKFLSVVIHIMHMFLYKLCLVEDGREDVLLFIDLKFTTAQTSPVFGSGLKSKKINGPPLICNSGVRFLVFSKTYRSAQTMARELPQQIIVCE